MELFGLNTQYAALGKGIEEAALSAMRSKRWIGGEYVSRLEYALSEYTGVKNCVTCASGTDALVLMLRAAGVKEGDAVFCPSFTFAATAEAVVLSGATPVFCDVDETLTLCPGSVSQKLTQIRREGKLRPLAILAVDLYGNPADRDALSALAKREGLKFLVDAAQSFGALWNDKSALKFCDAAAVSFFPTKPLGCVGDGGAVFTDDDSIADTVRSLCWHGAGCDKYENVRVGTNSRLDSIQAAVLLEKLAAFPSEMERRREVNLIYNKYLSKDVIPIVIKSAAKSAHALFTVRFSGEEVRRRAINKLNTIGIECGVYYRAPLHLQPAYTKFSRGPLPFSERAAREVLSLPMHGYLTEGEVRAVCDVLTEVV